MRKRNLAIVAVSLCICILLGFFVQQGGLSTLATALNVATTRVADLTSKSNTSAALGTDDNPFTILEIVPSREESQIGYYIPGCEPIDMEKAKYSQTAKDAFSSSLSDVYDIKVKTVYAFYDQIPSEAEKPNLTVLRSDITEAEATRTDVKYSDTYTEYGQWRKAPANSTYNEQGEFEYEGEGKGCFNYNGNDYDYVGEGKGSFVWIKSDYGETTRVASGDVFLYTYIEYDHKDTFISNVFSGSTSSEFKTQVITLTPSELDHELDLISTVDLISIHGATSEYTDLAKAYYELNSNGDSGTVRTAPTFWDLGKDLTYNEVIKIAERMASSNPCALLLDKNSMYATTAQQMENNCNKLLYMVLLYAPSDFWNAFSPYLSSYTGDDGTKKVEYTKAAGTGSKSVSRFWGQTITTAQWTYGGKSYTSATNPFLFNPDTGASMASQLRYYNINGSGSDIFTKIFAYDGSSMTVGTFLNGGKIANSAISSGIDTPNITSDAFEEDYEGAASVTNLEAVKFILQQAATMPKLRVLELEGCDTYIYGSEGWENYYQSLFSWYSPATDNPDGWLHDTSLIEVTTMPTWEFICSTGQYDYDELDEYGNSKTLTTESSDDLLAKYDVIIIGAKQDASNGLNGYNKYTRTLDGSTSVDLGNLVYVSVGGTIGTGTQQAYGGNTGDAEVMNIRYSGNDITLKKLLELEDFLRAGKPIVVDSGLYKDGQVDTAKVDKSSKIYDLLTWDGGDSGAQKNIFASNNINSSRMKNLIMNKSCRIEFYQGGYPTEYNYVSENTTEKYNDGKNNLVLNGKIVNEIYQSKSSNGTAVLTYHFYISGNDSDTYNAYLNIDLNGDGVYSSSLKEKSEVDNMNDALGLTGKDKKTYDTTESAMGLTIYDRNMNKLGTTDPDNPKKGYALKANTEYYATRTIPSSQQGMLPWKLEIQSRSNSYNRSSAVDYTAVYNSENKKTISVLQMTLQGDMSKDNSSLVSKNIWGNWNSMTAFTTDSIVVNTTDTYSTFKARMKATDDGQHYLPETESTRLNNLFSLYQKHTAAMFESYLEPVQEFDVTIQYMFNQDWYTLFGTTEKSGSTYKQKVANWEDFLSNYDMVVIGFIDSNSYTSNAVYQEGIKDFVNQGKSMILSHDTVSGSDVTKIGSAKSGYTENAVWLRTISGQRRAYYNKQKDGTYKKSYNDVKVNGVTYSLVTDYIVDYYDDLLGTYNPSDYGESGESYLVNEYPDNGNFIGTYYRIDGREGSTLNIERVAKSGTLGSGWPDNAYTSFIKLTNNGQITTYPYKLGSVIQVLNTHTQNFQLDLDYEEGGDVNVWFNLSDRYDSDVAAYITENNITSMITGANYYSARNQDGRNNFYIYNKGNITYTGSGHGVAYNGGYNGMMTSDEIKLFINTMIASYRQPESEPVVSLDDVDGTDSEGTGLIYLDYDGYTYDEADGTSGSTVKNGADSRVEIVDGKEQVAVYFTVTDIGTATLTNKNCYLSITQPSATDAGKEVAVDPGTVKLIEISTDKDGKEVRETIKTNSDGKYLVDSTNSGVHYVMYFPYSEVRDGTGTVEFNYTTQATYTKKNRDVTTTEKKTSVDIMLLPLFDLD